MQNEEIMITQEKKKSEETIHWRKSSHCIPESWSLRGTAAWHNMTVQVGLHREKLGPPTPLPSVIQFSPTKPQQSLCSPLQIASIINHAKYHF